MAESLRETVERIKKARGRVAKSEALSDLVGFEPRKRDLPDIYWALRQSYHDDQSRRWQTRCSLFEMLREVHDAATPDVVRKVYPTLPPNKKIRAAALEALGKKGCQDELS